MIALILIICIVLGFSSCDAVDNAAHIDESIVHDISPRGVSTYPLPDGKTIVIDGKAGDWNSVPALAIEKNQSMLVLKAAHSLDHMFVCVTGSRMGPYYGVYLNTDDNPATGYQGSPWGIAGFDYLIENGVLYRSLGAGWSWEYLGTAPVTASSNVKVVELRVARTALAELADSITIGVIDIGSSWYIRSIMPKTPPLPHYTIVAGTRQINMLVPAYFYPGPLWDALAIESSLAPGRLIAIANPGSGPGAVVDPNYTDAIGSVRMNNGRVAGYVYTEYGNRPLADVFADIDRWYQFYQIDGIFLDQQANTAGKEEYYRSLYERIKTEGPNALVIGNPGASTIESYLVHDGERVTDILCIFETDSGFLSWQPPLWCSGYGSENFCVLPFSTAVSDYPSYIDHAVEQKSGWIFCTNDVLPNPWDTLPPYLSEMCGYIRSTY